MRRHSKLKFPASTLPAAMVAALLLLLMGDGVLMLWETDFQALQGSARRRRMRKTYQPAAHVQTRECDGLGERFIITGSEFNFHFTMLKKLILVFFLVAMILHGLNRTKLAVDTIKNPTLKENGKVNVFDLIFKIACPIVDFYAAFLLVKLYLI